MNEQQRLFLVQAQSGFVVFGLLRAGSVHHCHALHYLQMATELLGKAYDWKAGPSKLSHKAFVRFLRNLSSNRMAQRQLGYDGKDAQWLQLIRISIPLAADVEKLAPKLAGNNPNPEYPWPPAMPHSAPVEHDFQVWQMIQTTAGNQFLKFAKDLFEKAGSFL